MAAPASRAGLPRRAAQGDRHQQHAGRVEAVGDRGAASEGEPLEGEEDRAGGAGPGGERQYLDLDDVREQVDRHAGGGEDEGELGGQGVAGSAETERGHVGDQQERAEHPGAPPPGPPRRPAGEIGHPFGERDDDTAGPHAEPGQTARPAAWSATFAQARSERRRAGVRPLTSEL